MLLAADVGGTNARVALFERGNSRPRVVEKYRTAAWDGAPSLLAEFVATHPVPLTGACVAVAGPVRGGRADVINLPWPVEADQIARALRLPEVALVNDLEANARGVAVLGPDDLFPLSAGDPAAAGNRVVVSQQRGSAKRRSSGTARASRPLQAKAATRNSRRDPTTRSRCSAT